MLAKGNADPEVCVNNLISTWKKEAFYGRLKGVSTTYQDKPFSTASEQIESDVEELIDTYEERVEVNEVLVDMDEESGILITADVEITNESLDEDEEEEDTDE